VGPVIFFSGEEPEAEMRRRLHRSARKRGLEPSDLSGLHFHFADPDACLLGVARRDGTMAPTPLFASLAAAAREIRPVLIVVDSIAATFGGNQNDRVHARTFVGLFRTLARQVDCAILLLDHPSLSGIVSGTGRGGSMDWQNATRARLHLETVDSEDGSTGRVLEVKKTNYGPPGEKVRLQWEDGSFVIEGTASAPHQAAANSVADQHYLECLDAVTTQGRHVCPGKGRGYPGWYRDDRVTRAIEAAWQECCEIGSHTPFDIAAATRKQNLPPLPRDKWTPKDTSHAR
jgi:RecA-family ATPase